MRETSGHGADFSHGEVLNGSGPRTSLNTKSFPEKPRGGHVLYPGTDLKPPDGLDMELKGT